MWGVCGARAPSVIRPYPGLPRACRQELPQMLTQIFVTVDKPQGPPTVPNMLPHLQGVDPLWRRRRETINTLADLSSRCSPCPAPVFGEGGYSLDSGSHNL